MKEYLSLILKGMAMGAANVIPGVSGGTIALITGIFEKLIDSIKSFDIEALKLFFSGKFKEFAIHINLSFLLSVFLGIGISIISLARILDYLFINFPIFIWAFFFGLILASVYSVGKTISKWSVSVILLFIIGMSIAIYISLANPGVENDSVWYLIICGVVAICSMILPGLSGSFILILMGNYQLIMIDSVKSLDIKILSPVAIGAGLGLIAFSHFLSWIFKKFKDQTISLLTGFILGSLLILWPWKNSYLSLDPTALAIEKNQFGAFIMNGEIVSKVKVFRYEQILPDSFGIVEISTIGFMIIGFIGLWIIEKHAQK